MYFFDKATKGFYLEDVVNSRVQITDDYYAELFRQQQLGKVIVPDEKGYPIAINPVKTTSDIILEQAMAIDNYIAKMIKQAPLNYDSIGEVAMYVNSRSYEIEARKLMAWIEKCHEVQLQVPFESIDDAISALPNIENFINNGELDHAS